MRYFHVFLASLLFFFSSCQKQSKDFSLHPSDYESFLAYHPDEDLKNMEKNFAFWQKKFEQNPNQYPYLRKMAAVKSQLFALKQDILDLKDAEKYIEKAIELSPTQNSDLLRSLAHNFISQHRFKEALEFLVQAEHMGDKLFATHAMLFDVHLELGILKKQEAT